MQYIVCGMLYDEGDGRFAKSCESFIDDNYFRFLSDFFHFKRNVFITQKALHVLRIMNSFIHRLMVIGAGEIQNRFQNRMG